MRCGFRPHDRDRTPESMERVWMGSWDVVKRGWAAKRRGIGPAWLLLRLWAAAAFHSAVVASRQFGGPAAAAAGFSASARL